ncbi:MAG: hypothetical protein JRF15_14130 [Deltaproteobacteria bacterium]|nr:hypothetical protein [Deltaproteobacteria bacterium]
MASLAALVIASAPASVMAEGGQISVRADLEYQYADTEIKDEASGEKTDTDFSRFKHKYDVELRQELLPFLEIRSGGIFEFIDLSSNGEGFDADSHERTRWLFGELNLNNPLYTASTAYRRRKFEFNRDDTPKLERDREEIAGLLKWRPVGFPEIDLDVDTTRIWDKANTVDQTVDRVLLKSRYDYRDVHFDYTYTRLDTDRKIEDAGSLNQVHDAGVSYTDEFFEDRLQLTSAARLNYQILEPRGNEVVERPTPLPDTVFYFAIDGDPNTLELVPPASLTDINIGQGGGFNTVSVGLYFDLPTAADRIHIGLDADETVVFDVAEDFVWTVSWTDDTDLELAIWNTFPANSVKAKYDPIENRFEISFPRVENAIAIKVATDPQPTATGPILISRIQAFTTVAVSPGEDLEDIDHHYSLGLRWAFSDRTDASYQGYFRHQKFEPFDTTKKTFTNGLSLRHQFHPKLVGNAKVLRTDTDETARDDLTNHSYSASLRADYFDTLRQTLTYSGFHDDLGGRTSYSNAILLRTNADLYEGWSAIMDLSYSAKHLTEGDDLNDATVRLTTNVDPHPKLKFVFDYRLSHVDQTGRSSWLDHRARFQGFWVPLRTLSFFASVRLRDNGFDDEGLLVSQNYSVSWSPFPDGLLRFSVGYNRSVDTRDNTVSALSPRIDWQVTRTTLFTLLSNLGTTETDRETIDVKNVRLTLRTFF